MITLIKFILKCMAEYIIFFDKMTNYNFGMTVLFSTFISTTIILIIQDIIKKYIHKRNKRIYMKLRLKEIDKQIERRKKESMK